MIRTIHPYAVKWGDLADKWAKQRELVVDFLKKVPPKWQFRKAIALCLRMCVYTTLHIWKCRFGAWVVKAGHNMGLDRMEL